MIDWTQLTVAIAALLVLFYVVFWNSKQQEKRDDRQALHDELQAKRYEDLLGKYAALTTNVLDVVRENTKAVTLVERGINGLPEFVRQVDQRLANGQQKFVEHAQRLEKLETKKARQSGNKNQT